MKPSTSSMFNDNQEQMRTQLCDAVVKEKENFLKIAQNFYDKNERTEQNCLELTEAIVDAIDTVLASGNWESSLFLKNTIKPLRQLREEALKTLSEFKQAQGQDQIVIEHQLKPDECYVYVSLYQTDGHDMQKWESQLRSINAHMIGRPIYKNEEDIKKVIRQKLLQTSEAYAIAVVSNNKVLANEFSINKTDRHGFELMTVEMGAITANDVIEFIHLNKRYYFKNQSLTLKHVPIAR